MASNDGLRADIQLIVQALIIKNTPIVTMEELNTLLPKRELGSADIEDIFAALHDHGIDIVE